MGNWQYENDEEELDKWLIRDMDTDNGDLLAVVFKTVDEEYDAEVIWPAVAKMAAAEDLYWALKEAFDTGFFSCNCGDVCDGSCTYSIMQRALLKAEVPHKGEGSYSANQKPKRRFPRLRRFWTYLCSKVSSSRGSG